MAEAVRVKATKPREKKKKKSREKSSRNDETLELPEPPTEIPGDVSAEEDENIVEQITGDTGDELKGKESVDEEDPGILREGEDEQGREEDVEGGEGKEGVVEPPDNDDVVEQQEEGRVELGEEGGGTEEVAKQSGTVTDESGETENICADHSEAEICDTSETPETESEIPQQDEPDVSDDFVSWERVTERGETNSMLAPQVQPSAPMEYVSMSPDGTQVRDLGSQSEQADVDQGAEQQDVNQYENAQTENTGVVGIGDVPLVDEQASPLLSSFRTDDVRIIRDVREHLYPEIEHLSPEEMTLEPLSENELKLYYFNPQLQKLDGYVDQFIQDCYQERHEFFELVYQYYRSRHNLVAIETDIKSLQKDYHRQREDIWLITENVINAQGECSDRVRVSEQFSFKRVKFNQQVGNALGRILTHSRSLVHDTLSLCAYTVQLSSLQVESYIYHLFSRSSVLSELDSNAPVTAHVSTYAMSSPDKDIQNLKQCISVLFTFYRRPIKDEEFIEMLQHWTKRLVAALLRVACLEDHVFLMNHIIRCPSGISAWATPFVQLVLPSSLVGASRGREDWGDPLLDHFMCMLACLMLPVKGREEFLAKLKVTWTPEPDRMDEHGFTWTLVDEDGEEDEDPATSWMLLHENDLVSLLAQFPFGAMFKHILLIDDAAEKPYDIHRVTSYNMMKLISFGTSLVQLLGRGFKTFNRSRYRQFVKRIGRLVRHTVQYVADHWQNYRTWRLETMKDKIDAVPLVHPYNKQHSVRRLQVEYDQFFLRGVQCILCDQRHGAWQFMTDMPYKSVSSHMMWHLLWMLHQGSISEDEVVDKNVSPKEYLNMVRDIDNRLAFEEKLITMSTSEVIYLLTSFAFMARSRPTTEKDFIETITLEVYELAYVSSHTREFCCKVGRELLSSIATIHPFIMSTLLHQMCIYLYQTLPVHRWIPRDEDVALIRVWLLEHNLTSAENQLARLVLSKMNWGFNQEEDALYLDLKLHRNTAVLVVEAYSKFIMEKGGGILADTFSQLAYLATLAPGMKSGLTPEQQLSTWCWELALKLRLHQLEQPETPLAAYDHPTDWSRDVPDMTSDPSLHPIQKGVQANGPLACYVAVAMTTVGHSVDLFLTEGLKSVLTLVSTGYYKAVIHVISLFVPMFLNQSQYLLQNEKFQKIIRSVVQADRSSVGLTGKLIMSPVFPGEITTMFSAMIMYQLQCAGTPGSVTRNDVLEFWIRLFTAIEFWNTDRDIQYLMDILIRAAFTYKGAENIILDVFFVLYKSLLSSNKEQGVLSSLMTWMVSGNSMPSLMEKPSAEWPWLAYGILCVESRYEEDSQMRNTVCTLLSRDSKLSPEAAVKKASTKLKLPYSHSANRLMVYRWVYQALETPMDHPLLPILWQRFFMVYLQRMAPEQGLPQRGSIGPRFFESLANSSLLKRCKKRLVQTADHHHSASKKAAASHYDDNNSSDASEEISDESPPLEKVKYRVSAEFHQSLVKLYQTFILWIDEPRLHEASLYLPALPPQYDADKLLKILHNEQDMWTEYIDPVRTEYETAQLVSLWVKLSKSSHYQDSRRASLLTREHDKSAESRILHRLEQYDPSQAPPPVGELKSPVPDISADVVNDRIAMLRELEGDVKNLVEYAGLFNTREANHIALDCNYIELLPDLFYHKPTEVNLQIPCRSNFNPNHKCSGPASVTLSFREMTMNSITARKIEENRNEYKEVLQESMSPPPMAVCSSAVHIENAITALIKRVRGKSVQERQSLAAHLTGVELFYTLAAESDDDIRHYPPTRQFFSTCLEILGQEFIRDTPDQSEPLLGVMLEKPVLAGQLAPNFIPNQCRQEFVSMYAQITKIAVEESALAFMLLTKFDLPKWFRETKPILSLRSQLADVIGSALCRCGQDPDVQIQMLFEMYRTHIQLILKYQFPDHYGDVLRILLQGSEKGQMSPLCWDDLLRSLGCTYNRQERMDEDEQRIKCLIQTQSLLSQEQIKETMEWLTSYFQKLRVSSPDVAKFGLYSKWRPYIKALSNFLGFLSQSHIVKEAERVISIGMGVEQAIDQLWKLIQELFTPWIVTIETLTTTGSHLVAPWLESDSPAATDMVALFTESVQCLQVQFQDILPHYTRDALSLFWPYYVNVLAHKGVVDHVLRVYHARFIVLPWQQFYPRLEAVELMLKLHAESSPDCFTFLGCIFPQMNWTAITDHYSRNESPEVASRLHVALLLLFVMFAKEKTIILTNTAMQSLMATAESFQWAYVDSSAYENIIQWQLNNTDPDAVLAERRGMEDRGLRLLRAAGGFRPDVAISADTPRKRCSYIRCIVQMICKCSHKSEVKVDSFKFAINDLMQDLESVASAAVDTNAMAMELVDLLIEVLNLLNNCASTGRAIEIVQKTLLDWIEANPCSGLLLPCITAACRTLASLRDMTVIVEACMDSYFNSGIDLGQYGGWRSILERLQVPELTHEEFLEECVRNGSYLTLYAYMLQKLPLCQNLNNELDILTKIVNWTVCAKPSPENESKLMLWWSKAVELCLRQVDFGAPHHYVIRTINNLTPALNSLGEDKDSSGLLGAIGLGRRSNLSLRIRLVCRSLSAFLLAQTPGNNYLRTQPHAPAAISKHQRAPLPNQPNVHPTAKAQQALASLESLRNNKHYAALRDTAYLASAFVTDPAHSLRDTSKLLAMLANNLFPEKNYLAILKTDIYK